MEGIKYRGGENSNMKLSVVIVSEVKFVSDRVFIGREFSGRPTTSIRLVDIHEIQVQLYSC